MNHEQIRDVMTALPAQVKPTASVAEVAQLMREPDIGSARSGLGARDPDAGEGHQKGDVDEWRLGRVRSRSWADRAPALR
jgi:CBS domain-containing protein